MRLKIPIHPPPGIDIQSHDESHNFSFCFIM